MQSTLVLTGAVLANASRADIVIDGELVTAVEPEGTAVREGARVIDLAGSLLLPAFVEGHAHLDKTFLGAAWQPRVPGSTVRERVEIERAMRRSLTVPVRDRALALVEQMVGYGTGHIRSHVDIDLDLGLSGLHALLEVREQCADRVTIQLVAFPQSGVLADPGVAELLDAALAEGADVVGGLDPWAFDGDVDGHLAVVFGLAEKHGAGVDIHLHDADERGLEQLAAIAGCTVAAGLQGRVSVSHAYCLGSGLDEVAQTAELLAEANVAIMTSGPAGLMPPVKRLRAAGVTVFSGSDNIRDAWWPYGNGDMLERASMVGYQSGFYTDEDLAVAADLVTVAGAKALGLDRYGVAPGCRADLVAVACDTLAEAVAAHPPRSLVLHGGRVIR
ncbi:amidohydrolase family protein [Streptosporangium sp. NPDC051023]|uniref:amidohydrolase family protein n=1 Tax=Streptosporangium sp. NPDC051023 TaxID=3155410 RepID=UPI00344E9C6D